MKKFFLFVACASFMVMGAQAQTAEDLFKAGKAEFDKYDKLLGEYFMTHQKDQNAPDPTGAERSAALLKGFDLLQKALPLDTVVETNKDGTPKIDKKTGKPKFKTKFSKDIVPILTSHVNDILNAGNVGLQANDYAAAFKAFNFYRQVVNSPIGADSKVDPETMGEVSFYEGYAAYQLKDYEAGYSAFKEAIKNGYKENQVVDFKNSCIANIIQGFVDAKEYDKAINYVDKSIVEDPNSGLLQDMKGFVVEQKDGLLAAEEYYRKATEADTNFSNGFFDYGRVIYEKAEKIIEDNPKATNAELKPKLVPLYNQALPLFKKAQELDPQNTNTQIKRFIDDIEYKLDLLK